MQNCKNVNQKAQPPSSYKILNWKSFMIFMVIYISGILLIYYEDADQVLYINAYVRPHKVNKNFLSVGLDSSSLAERFEKFNLSSIKLTKLVKHLTPCYFRLGGNLADRLSFVKYPIEPIFSDSSPIIECADNCVNVPNYTFSGDLWLKFNKFIENSGVHLIFDLNVLLRNQDGSWNSSNAEDLIKFSSMNDLKLDWELGNEPDSFYFKFNETVDASQLAKDYITLKNILKQTPYKKSLLIGPSITRIRNFKEAQYFSMFLQGAAKAVSAITWHHYYFNGRNATAEEFLSPKTFNFLKMHIQKVQKVTKNLTLQYKPLWLGETSSAWGGGAPNMSDRFISTFIWIDKLGLAAQMGVSLVVRQSIVKGYYALLDDNYDPNPDYWVSILYKNLVDPTVVPSLLKYQSKVRLYVHYAKRFHSNTAAPLSLTVFGINVNDIVQTVRINGVYFQPIIKAFELTTDEKSLLSKRVYLNRKLLKLKDNYDLPDMPPKFIDVGKTDLTMPAYSVCFWIIDLTSDKYTNEILS